jgi:hypothetical protein
VLWPSGSAVADVLGAELEPFSADVLGAPRAERSLGVGAAGAAAGGGRTVVVLEGTWTQVRSKTNCAQWLPAPRGPAAARRRGRWPPLLRRKWLKFLLLGAGEAHGGAVPATPRARADRGAPGLAGVRAAGAGGRHADPRARRGGGDGAEPAAAAPPPLVQSGHAASLTPY